MLLLLLACDTGTEPATAEDSGCREWEQPVGYAVPDETSECPAVEDVELDRIIRSSGCEGDEVLEVVESTSTAPSACSFLFNCEWSCSYEVRVRSCVMPTSCWQV